ncbi:MAG: RteC domain-containing protein [Tannerellaceae bacterium]|nr:RteC domain-containing protein [Tannerellaceae bacterium]
MKIAIKAIYLVELAKQVLEWRVTAPNNNTKFASENRLSFSGNNLLTNYLYGKDTTEHSLFSYPKTKMTWTGNKVDLVEIIYAWECVGCFNHGHTNIKEIATYIETVFNIDLGEYYGTFQEMRNRANRTAFLDSMIEALKKRMDEADRKK